MHYKSLCQIAGLENALVMPVKAALFVFYRVPNNAPGYRVGFTSEEIDDCFGKADPSEVGLRPAAWLRFSTADGRAGFERVRTSDLSDRDWRSGNLYLIRDRKKLLALLGKYPEALLRFDRPCSVS